MQTLDHVHEFIAKHHVMSLATSHNDNVSACSLFYVYSPKDLSFVVASSDDTLHIQHINHNNKVAGNIFLETQEVGKIQGLQIKGEFELLEDEELAKLYLKTFRYSQAMNPKLWQIKVSSFKMTDNELGFGKKLIWP